MSPDVFKNTMDGFRGEIKDLCEKVAAVKASTIKGEMVGSNQGEMIANVTLAFRHLEDAAMRLGKAIQASQEGVSPLGGPNTPQA